MKKFRKILVALVFAFMAFVGLTGCGKGDEIVGAQVMSGSIATTVAKGGTVDTSKMKAQIRYKKADTKTVDMSELEIVQAPDTSVVGETTMKVKYDGYEFTVTIRVVATEADVNSISQLESQWLTDYKANSGEQENEQNEFFIKNRQLLVGDDNPLDFRIRAAGRDGAGEPVLDIEQVRTNISIAVKVGATFVALDEDGIDTYTDAVDTENTTIDFSDAACGEVFQVVVDAVNKDLTAEENATTFTAEFKVIDGYNVYNATDLSIYDNANRNNLWADKKVATGMAGKDTKAIIFQNDITVTKNDVPAGYFWNKQLDGATYTTRAAVLETKTVDEETVSTLEGSAKDFGELGVYTRELKNGETFTVEGNYFMLDFSEYPRAVMSGTDNKIPEAIGGIVHKANKTMMTSHWQVFYNTIYDDPNNPNDGPASITEDTSFNFNNIRFYGNGALDQNVENSGGAILMKTNYANMNANNTLQHNFYIGYFVQYGVLDDPNTPEVEGEKTGNFYVKDCKGYNSYNSLFYCYGVERLIIEDGEFIDCGGPAIIGSHGLITNNDRNTGVSCQVDVINSNISSKVVGTEPWFVTYGATAIVQMLPVLDAFLDGNMLDLETGNLTPTGIPASGKSLYVDEYEGAKRLDFIGVLAVDAGAGLGQNNILPRGYIRLFNTRQEFESFYAGNSTNYCLNSNSAHAENAGGSLYYLEDAVNGGYINMGVAQNGDASLALSPALPQGYRMSILQQILSQPVNQEYPSITPISMYEAAVKENVPSFSFAALDYAGKKEHIQNIIKNMVDLTAAVPSADQLQALLTLYGAGRKVTNTQLTSELWAYSSSAVKLMELVSVPITTPEQIAEIKFVAGNLIADLCNQVAHFSDAAIGGEDSEGNSYLNIFIGGFGASAIARLGDKAPAQA